MKKLIALAVSLCLILSIASVCSFADENEEQVCVAVEVTSTEVSIDNGETAECQQQEPIDLEYPDPVGENLSLSQAE